MTTTTTTTNRTFTISNICVGDLRRFRFVDGQLSGAAIRYADRLERCAVGGPDFSDPEAAEQYQQICEARLSDRAWNAFCSPSSQVQS